MFNALFSFAYGLAYRRRQEWILWTKLFLKKNMLCGQNIQIVMMILKDAGMNAGNQSSDETKQQFKLAYVYIYTCL